MHKIILGIFSFVFLLSITATPLFAGGGPVALRAFSLRPFDQTKTFILEAEIYSNQPCDQIKATFTFNDPKDGDSITPYTTPLDGTYITRHYNTGQPDYIWKEICNFYMAAKSQTAEQRIITVNVFADGKTHTRETKVSFGDDYLSRQLQGFGRMNDYDNTPHPDVVQEKYIGNDKREVDLQWQKISWAAKYFVLAYVVKNDGTNTTPFEVTTTENTKATVTLPATTDLRIIINACRAGETCTGLKDENYSYLLSRMYNLTTSQPSTPKSTPVVTETEETVLPTTPVDEKVEELNKKVAELEGKLDESTKKQSALEKTVNDLLTWIKAYFPFFQ